MKKLQTPILFGQKREAASFSSSQRECEFALTFPVAAKRFCALPCAHVFLTASSDPPLGATRTWT